MVFLNRDYHEDHGVLVPDGYYNNGRERMEFHHNSYLTLRSPSSRFRPEVPSCYPLRVKVCRMFLHSVTLAGICTVDGKAVTMNAWQGCGDPSRGTEFLWPRVQTKLPDRYWTLWQKALSKCFLVSGSSRDLRDTLGRWSRVPPSWQWYYSPQEDRLYKKELWMWRAYPALRVRTSSCLGSPKYRCSDEVTRLCPDRLIMASVYSTKHSVTKEATLELLDTPVPSDNRPASIQRL